MRPMLAVLVLVPLLSIGCKKKAVEAAPVAAEAPSVAWSFGPARQVGAEGVGTLTIPVKVTVTGDKAVLVREADIGVDTDAGRVCVLRSTEMKKVEAGTTVEITLRGDCQASKLPDGDDVKLAGSVKYAYGTGDEQRLEVDNKVALQR